MTPEQWQKVRDVLAEALVLKPEHRSAFLDRACARDQALRREVEMLLASDERARSPLLQSGALGMAVNVATTLADLAVVAPATTATCETILEVISPDHSRRSVTLTESPFLIGRGGENHLQLSDRRISRQCAAIVREKDGHYLEDRGHRHGIFVNGKKIERVVLSDGDVITFGFDDCYALVFRSSAGEIPLQNLLAKLGNLPRDESSSAGLQRLNVLLEATSLLHSRLPLETVLGTMIDHAIGITNADRGLLLEGDSGGSLRIRLARGSGGTRLSLESLTPSQTAIRQALERKTSVVTEDLNRAGTALQRAQSIVAQSLRAIVAIPLYGNAYAASAASVSEAGREQLIGVIYLDSRRPAAFSKLDRQILDALALEAASILENARLVERERERQRLEEQLNVAREIQRALIPTGFRDFPHFAATGVHTPCHAVGGDYFDVFPLSEDRTAIVVADVSGKGLGAALLTTMLQGALSGMTIGTDPVRVIQHVNRFLCEHAQVERYATMFFAVLHASGELVYICAGHPSPLILRRGEVTELVTRGCCPVGLLPHAEFAAATARLEHSDTLVLFTDGVTEAMSPELEPFGIDRLQDALTGKAGVSLEQLQGAVIQSVQNFTRGAAQSDDITLLLVRYRATGAAASSSE
jgi:phosphoserine phosphatase RsbU/P